MTLMYFNRIMRFLRVFYKDAGKLLTLAIPILGAQLSVTAMGFVDTSMSGHVSPQDLASIGIGTSIWIPLYVFVVGLCLALTPTVAQFYAGRNIKQIAPNVIQSLWIAFFCALLLLYGLQYSSIPMTWLRVDPHLIPLASAYLGALSWGIPAIIGYSCLYAYCEGMADTKPGLIFGVIGLALNILSNYILIYGHFGAPALGAVGCGYATAISFWVMLLSLVVYIHCHKEHKKNRIFAHFLWPDRAIIGRLLKLGVPIGLSIFSETLLFCIIALLIGFLGPKTVAGHQLSLNFSSLVFMIPLSIGSSTTIRVSHQVGAGRPYRARFSAYTGVMVGALCSSVVALLIALFPDAIISMYTKDAQVADIARTLLMFVAVFQIVDAIQNSASGALRGYKDTLWPFILNFFAYWCVAFPLGYVLGLTNYLQPASGPQGLWSGLVIGLTLLAVLNMMRLYYVTSRHIRNSKASLSTLRSPALDAPTMPQAAGMNDHNGETLKKPA